jgi:DNA helicase-2/ATP-dependent DNA helicase PcrA
MTPSKYQSAIFSFVASGSGSAVIEAVAGSGKTTTIVQAAQNLTDYIFLAFNKAIAEDLKARNVNASTFHALGFRELNSRLSKKPKVDGKKVQGLFYALVPEPEQDEYYDLIKLVSLAKNSAFSGDESNEDWEALIDDFDLTFPDLPHAIALADRLLELSNSRLDIIDFDDMLYLPWKRNFLFQSYHTVFIDEAQDTNKLQLLLLRKIVGARLIAVGDQAQAIYGFRGAGTGSMSAIREMFNCSELPLSISYRCPQAVVREARHYAPQIESWEFAESGIVDRPGNPSPKGLVEGSVVICRLNKPLVQLAYALVRAGRSVNYLGRDLSASFKTLIKRAADGALINLPTLSVRLEAARDIELEKAADKTWKIIAIEDKYDSLLSILEQLPETATSRDACDAVTSIFRGAPGASITLSTVHKAKGLEWPVVYILDADRLMPHPKAKDGWTLQQEYNMLYVAITRSKRELYFINSEDFK